MILLELRWLSIALAEFIFGTIGQIPISEAYIGNLSIDLKQLDHTIYSPGWRICLSVSFFLTYAFFPLIWYLFPLVPPIFQTPHFSSYSIFSFILFSSYSTSDLTYFFFSFIFQSRLQIKKKQNPVLRLIFHHFKLDPNKPW